MYLKRAIQWGIQSVRESSTARLAIYYVVLENYNLAGELFTKMDRTSHWLSAGICYLLMNDKVNLERVSDNQEFMKTRDGQFFAHLLDAIVDGDSTRLNTLTVAYDQDGRLTEYQNLMLAKLYNEMVSTQNAFGTPPQIDLGESWIDVN
jgi:hypothetical protein